MQYAAYSTKYRNIFFFHTIRSMFLNTWSIYNHHLYSKRQNSPVRYQCAIFNLLLSKIHSSNYVYSRKSSVLISGWGSFVLSFARKIAACKVIMQCKARRHKHFFSYSHSHCSGICFMGQPCCELPQLWLTLLRDCMDLAGFISSGTNANMIMLLPKPAQVQKESSILHMTEK